MVGCPGTQINSSVKSAIRLPVNDCVKRDIAEKRPGRGHRPDALNKSSRLSPHHRFVIALRSPRALPETGLRTRPPEKVRQSDAIWSRAVHSLQSALRTKYCEIWACFAYFVAKVGADSLQFRLAGGEIGIRTFITLCVRSLRVDVSVLCNGFCNMCVSSGEFAEPRFKEKQSLSLFCRTGKRRAIVAAETRVLRLFCAEFG
jgi:hypothetical protein